MCRRVLDREDGTGGVAESGAASRVFRVRLTVSLPPLSPLFKIGTVNVWLVTPSANVSVPLAARVVLSGYSGSATGRVGDRNASATAFGAMTVMVALAPPSVALVPALNANCAGLRGGVLNREHGTGGIAQGGSASRVAQSQVYRFAGAALAIVQNRNGKGLADDTIGERKRAVSSRVILAGHSRATAGCVGNRDAAATAIRARHRYSRIGPAFGGTISAGIKR